MPKKRASTLLYRKPPSTKNLSDSRVVLSLEKNRVERLGSIRVNFARGSFVKLPQPATRQKVALGYAFNRDIFASSS
jgi:hypothetical protein